MRVVGNANKRLTISTSDDEMEITLDSRTSFCKGTLVSSQIDVETCKQKIWKEIRMK